MFVEHKEALEITEAPVKTLKLSEAMRLGASRTKQCTAGQYIQGDESCAWGAAAIGMGGGHDLAMRLHKRDDCADMAFMNKYGTTIMKANDKGGWTRERIADALEALGY